MNLEKHTIWSVFPDAKDFETFQQKVLRPFQANPQITSDIRENIDIVNKLLLHSFYEYEFIDIAFVQAVFTLEKALKARYAEIHNKEFKKNLFDLLEWFFNNGYFEFWNKDILHIIRKIRNGKVHEIKKTVGGIVFLKRVYQILDAINDIYEDTSLRSTRKENIKSIQLNLNEFCQQGAILSYNDQRYIIFNANILFINNKHLPETLYLVFWPIFDPKPYTQEDKHFISKSFFIRASNLIPSANSIQLIELGSGNNLQLTKITDTKNIQKYDEWKKECEPIITNGIVDALIQIQNEDHFDTCLRTFYDYK